MNQLKYIAAVLLLSCMACDHSQKKEGHFFSVSDTTRVEFASGNLAEDGLGFVAKSTDYGGLFGWGTGENLKNYSEDYHDYPEFHGWGENLEGGWRTLTIEEWRYLLFERPDADNKCSTATIDSVNGLLLLPDYFVLPTGCEFKRRGHGWGINVYNQFQWRQMDSAGAVFLPCSGFRWGRDIYGLNCEGIYWSSTSTDSCCAHSMYFSSDTLDTDPDGERHFGHSVRLVRVVE